MVYTVSRLVQRLGVGVGFYRVGMGYKANGDLKETQIGILSAHDCRHYCATDMARKGYTIKKLMDWFGWTSPAMAMRYVESAEIHVRDMG
jgi:integrase